MTETPKQVAVIGVRGKSSQPEICLIRPKSSGKWGIPKGFIDRGNSPEDAAAQEAREEAGVSGRMSSNAIGSYRYLKGTVPLTVTVYLMEVLEEHHTWHEMNHRERKWVSLAEARMLLSDHPVRPLLDEVTKVILMYHNSLLRLDSKCLERN